MKRMKPKERKAQILEGAVYCATVHGFNNFTRVDVAQYLGISEGLVNVYFKTMPTLKRKVMRAAVRDGALVIIAQGLIDKNPHAMKASKGLKKRALDSVL